MKTSKLFFALIAAITLLHAVTASAADTIDMTDPRRLVGREDDVRIDAQLIQDTVSPGASIRVTYQIQNFTAEPVAVADKVMDATYDAETMTITFAIGAEVPPDGKLPHLVTIAPGEKKVFRAGAMPNMNSGAIRSSFARPPRYVQVKVSILRDLTPYNALMIAQPRGGQILTDEQFDKWFESNDSIFLNAVPVRFSPRRNNNLAAADRRFSPSSAY
jgi:hypothetical protein